MSSLQPTSSTPQEIYHQIVPHFILHQFLFVPSAKLRQRLQHFWREHIAPGERVLIYDLAAGLLQERRVYSKPYVFNYLVDSTNVDSELKDFEQAAAAIVRAIHDGLKAGKVTLSRAGLSTLRKFIFVSHYRRLAVQIDPSRGEGLTQLELQTWIRGLRYYLETPHCDIIATGERLRERYEAQVDDMSKNQSYPDHEEEAFQFALEYEALANNYFLGVWVAAEATEFILSGHAFSLREGSVQRNSVAHRIHIVTPRIAIVLRKTCLHDPSSKHPSILYSSLADVPISSPVVRYVDEGLIDALEADPDQAKSIMNAYRATATAEQDSFTFPFTQLSHKQTYAVNEIIMMNANLGDRTSIIFRQPSVMRDTLALYMNSYNTFLDGKRTFKFRPLAVQLAELGSQFDPQIAQVPSPLLLESENESAADRLISLLLGFMTQDYISFPSAYTRAFFIFHTATVSLLSNPISLGIRNIQDAAIDKLQCVLDPPLPEPLGPVSTYNGLVQSLESDESDIFFSLVPRLLDQADVGIRRSNDFVGTVINEAAIIGVTYWLAEERPDVLKDLLSPWVHIWA